MTLRTLRTEDFEDGPQAHISSVSVQKMPSHMGL